MTDSNTINKQDVLQDHSPLIHRVVSHCERPDSVPDLEEVLQLATKNDWGQLVETIRTIMAGNHEQSLLQNLDEEESIIIESILDGLKDPNTLPSLPAISADLQSDLAAPGIASLIHAAIQGSAESQNMINELTQRMLEAGGDSSIVAGRIRLMVTGERNLGETIANISAEKQKLLKSILTELTALETKQ